MSAIKKERTPEQIEAAKARMAAVRAKKGSKPKSDPAPMISQFPREREVEPKQPKPFLKKGPR